MGEQPLDASALVDRAISLMTVGRIDLAIEPVRAALAVDPTSALAHRVLARCLAHAGRDLKGAEAEIQAAMRLDPEDQNTVLFYAEVEHDLGHWDEAEWLAREAVAMDPDDVDARVTLAETLLGRWRPAEALVVAGDAVRLAPNEPAAHDKMGIALAHLGRLREAREALLRGLILAPDSARLQSDLGLILYLQGEPDAALARYVEAARLEPSKGVAVANIERLFSDLGDDQARNERVRRKARYGARRQLAGWWWNRKSAFERLGITIGLLLGGVVLPLLWMWIPFALRLELARWPRPRASGRAIDRVVRDVARLPVLAAGWAVAGLAILAWQGPLLALYNGYVGIVLLLPLMTALTSDGLERLVGAVSFAALFVAGAVLILVVPASERTGAMLVYLLVSTFVAGDEATIVRWLRFRPGTRQGSADG
jgi:tetratricopeptide (TPR) repeat protein